MYAEILNVYWIIENESLNLFHIFLFTFEMYLMEDLTTHRHMYVQTYTPYTQVHAHACTHTHLNLLVAMSMFQMLFPRNNASLEPDCLWSNLNSTANNWRKSAPLKKCAFSRSNCHSKCHNYILVSELYKKNPFWKFSPHWQIQVLIKMWNTELLFTWIILLY